MRTIDEAIESLRKSARKSIDYEWQREQYQLAGWLEDYKRLSTEKEQDVYERAYRDGQDKGLSDGHFFGYTKAVNDFAEKLCDKVSKESLEVILPDGFRANAVTLDYVTEIVIELAEQLKSEQLKSDTSKETGTKNSVDDMEF